MLEKLRQQKVETLIQDFNAELSGNNQAKPD